MLQKAVGDEKQDQTIQSYTYNWVHLGIDGVFARKACHRIEPWVEISFICFVEEMASTIRTSEAICKAR
jgi:hypothetical protein